MKIDEIKGISRGLISVRIGNRILMITGELTTKEFYADKASIQNWEPPFDRELISDQEKEAIVASIENKTTEASIPIVFQ